MNTGTRQTRPVRRKSENRRYDPLERHTDPHLHPLYVTTTVSGDPSIYLRKSLVSPTEEEEEEGEGQRERKEEEKKRWRGGKGTEGERNYRSVNAVSPFRSLVQDGSGSNYL